MQDAPDEEPERNVDDQGEQRTKVEQCRDGLEGEVPDSILSWGEKPEKQAEDEVCRKIVGFTTMMLLPRGRTIAASLDGIWEDAAAGSTDGWKKMPS